MKNLLFSGCFLLLGTAAATAQTWTQIPVPTQKQLNAIDFPSASVGYIGGNDSILLKTTNGGRTWQKVSYTGVTFYPGNEHILNLQFVSETVGYMTVGPYSGAYKTVNGGTTWSLLSASMGLCSNEGLFFFDENNGFIGGAGCFQGEMIDRQSGGTWSAATVNFPGIAAEDLVTDIDFYSSSLGIATSFGGRFLRTTNGGQTWDSIQSPLENLTSVAFVNDTLCYAGYALNGSGFGLLISTDAGLTWEEDMETATFFYPNFNDVHVTGSGAIYTGGKPGFDNTGVLFSFAPADGWWNPGSVDETIYAISSYNDSIVFAVGNEGYVITNVNPATLTVAENELQPLTVYPNPTRDVLAFSAPELRADEPVTFRVFSASGELIREETTTGQQLNVEALTNGMYFLEVQQHEIRNMQRFVKE